MGCGPPKRALVHRSWTLKARASGSGAQLIRLITSFGCAGTDCHRVSHTHAAGPVCDDPASLTLACVPAHAADRAEYN